MIDIEANIRERDSGRVARGKAYRLGYTLAKIAWYQGKKLEFQVLQEQINGFAADLALPKEVIATALAQFTFPKDPKVVLRNARSGLEGRNAIGSLIEARLGASTAAGFRLGFGIVYVFPAFEFLSVGHKAGLPLREMAGSVESQLRDVVTNATLVGIPEQFVGLLKTIDSDVRKVDTARMAPEDDRECH